MEKAAEKAAIKAVSLYVKNLKETKNKTRKRLLFNTKKLLENYTKLKDYAEQAVVTLEQFELH